MPHRCKLQNIFVWTFLNLIIIRLRKQQGCINYCHKWTRKKNNLKQKIAFGEICNQEKSSVRNLSNRFNIGKWMLTNVVKSPHRCFKIYKSFMQNLYYCIEVEDEHDQYLVTWLVCNFFTENDFWFDIYFGNLE